MRRPGSVFLCLAALSGGGSVSPGATSPELTPERLRCEYLEQPLGIEESHPRLSWQLRGGRRGETQTAFQILVATAPEGLHAQKPDLWDSGKVNSPRSAQIRYEGKPLCSRQRCFWTVRVWNESGEPGPYSSPSWWEMGLLQEGDWTAEWIGQEQRIVPVIGLEEARWIAPPVDSDGATTSPVSAWRFTRTIPLPQDRRALSARLRVAGDCRAEVFWNGRSAGSTSGDWTALDLFDLRDGIRGGDNELTFVAQAAGKEPCLAARVEILPETGGGIFVVSDKEWHVSAVEGNKTGETTAAREIAGWGEGRWEVSSEPACRINAHPAPMLRRTFTLDQPVRSARVYVCGLGYHDLSINGRRVSDHVLDPAYTAYDKRVLYVTHDVTGLLQQGENAVGVTLGTGWYDVHSLAVWNFDAAPWRARPRLLLQLEAVLEDGRRVTVASDEEWKISSGPTRFDSIYEGETYDARQEKPGWDTAKYDDSQWVPAGRVSPPAGALHAQQVPPIRAKETLRPVALAEPRPGVFVFDLGRNIAGFPRLRITTEPGTRIAMRCGERLNPDGTVDQDEIFVYTGQRDPRQQFQTATYIARGGGEETWEPRFTYMGFQYVEVTGTSAPLTLENLSATVIHTDLERVGKFECSDPLLNRIWEATLNAYLGNLHGIPTDCPTREKNGWTGDAHLACELALLNFDGGAFYTKWLNDVADAQKDNGDLPGIVPTGGWGYDIGIGPSWDTALFIIPWTLHEFYADTRILERHYESMCRYLDFLTSRASDGIVAYGLGDWVPFETETPPALTSTAYYYRNARILSDAARLLGKNEDAARYGKLADSIRTAFNRKFFNADTGSYANGSQTALSCALFQDLVNEDQKTTVVQNLLRAVEARDYHIDTGILGSRYLLNALLDAGHADVAMKIATQRDLPSWGYWIEQGATTLWEQWRGQDSRNHVMFGDIAAWFIRALAGIRPAAPGYEKVLIRPRIVGDLTWARGEYKSIRGRIASDWRLEDGKLLFHVSLPPNTVAEIWIPTAEIDKVEEGNGPVTGAEGIEVVGPQEGCLVVRAGGGEYSFRAPY